MSDKNQSKDTLRSAYNGFLQSDAGKDLLKQAAILEKSYVLQAIKGQTSEEKAHSICRMEGVVTLRDYIIRMSKP